jgi:hypothetical protein
MKTKVLFAAALLLSTASFAQELTAKSEQATTVSTTAGNSGSSGNANISSSSNASVKTNAANKTARIKEEAKKTIVAQKEAVKGQTSTDIKTAQKAVQENGNESGTVYAGARVGAGSKSNKISQDASLSEQTKSSLSKTSINAKKETKRLKGSVKAVKPKPASFKMQTQLRTNAGLKIR